MTYGTLFYSDMFPNIGCFDDGYSETYFETLSDYKWIIVIIFILK